MARERIPVPCGRSRVTYDHTACNLAKNREMISSSVTSPANRVEEIISLASLLGFDMNRP